MFRESAGRRVRAAARDAAEIAPDDVLLGEEVRTARLAEVEHRDHVRVHQRRREVGLVDEEADRGRVAVQLGAQTLDHERPAKLPTPKETAVYTSAIPPTPIRSTSR